MTMTRTKNKRHNSKAAAKGFKISAIVRLVCSAVMREV